MTEIKIPQTGITITSDDVIDWRSTNSVLQIVALSNLAQVEAFPAELCETLEEWRTVLDTIIQGFHAVLALDEPGMTAADEKVLNELVTEGLRKYAEVYLHLWV